MHQHNPELRILAEGRNFLVKIPQEKPHCAFRGGIFVALGGESPTAPHSPSHQNCCFPGQHRDAQHPPTLPWKNRPNSFIFYSPFFFPHTLKAELQPGCVLPG